MITESHSILPRWRNHFYQLLSAHGDNDIRHTTICTDEQLVPDPNAFVFRISFDKLKRHKSASTDQIQAELIKAVGKTKFLGP